MTFTGVRFLVLYDTPNDPAAFDRHYHEVHIPLVRKVTLFVTTPSTETWSSCEERGRTT